MYVRKRQKFSNHKKNPEIFLFEILPAQKNQLLRPPGISTCNLDLKKNHIGVNFSYSVRDFSHFRNCIRDFQTKNIEKLIESDVF